MPGSAAGTAVGSTIPLATNGPQGPAHPGPNWMFHPSAPLGLMSTAWVDPGTPPTEKGVPELTMTVLPSFSVMATRTEMDSWAGDRPFSEVPP